MEGPISLHFCYNYENVAALESVRGQTINWKEYIFLVCDKNPDILAVPKNYWVTNTSEAAKAIVTDTIRKLEPIERSKARVYDTEADAVWWCSPRNKPEIDLFGNRYIVDDLGSPLGVLVPKSLQRSLGVGFELSDWMRGAFRANLMDLEQLRHLTSSLAGALSATPSKKGRKEEKAVSFKDFVDSLPE